MKRRTIMLVAVCFATLLVGCASQRQTSNVGTVNHADDEAAIRKADSTWSTVAEARNVDGHLSYFTDDAIVMAPNEPMRVGRDSIRVMMTQMFSSPGFAIKWQVTKVEVAGSGDLGYSIGTYEAAMADAKGTAVSDHGKYTTVWKKQADGSWKVAVDMFNSDVPPPQRSS